MLLPDAYHYVKLSVVREPSSPKILLPRTEQGNERVVLLFAIGQFLGRGLEIRPADIHGALTESRREAAGANQPTVWSHNPTIVQKHRGTDSQREVPSREASDFANRGCDMRSKSSLSTPTSEHGQENSFRELDSFNPLEEEHGPAHTSHPTAANGRSRTSRFNGQNQPPSSLSGGVGSLLSTPSCGIEDVGRPRKTVSNSHMDMNSLSPYETESVECNPKEMNVNRSRVRSLPRSEALLLPSSRANERDKKAEQPTTPAFHVGARVGPNGDPKKRHGRALFEDENECSRPGSYRETMTIYGVVVDRAGASLPGMGSKESPGRVRGQSSGEDGGLTVEAYMEKRRMTKVSISVPVLVLPKRERQLVECIHQHYEESKTQVVLGIYGKMFESISTIEHVVPFQQTPYSAW